MSKATILIVEDEETVAADLTHKLGQLGYEISGRTPRGEEAIALARELRPDLVLMDIHLKGPTDGIEAAGMIHRQYDLPVIYLTAPSDRAALQRAKITEPFGYILKPFEEQELETRIEMALYKHRAERKLREDEERLRLATETANLGFFDWNTRTGETYLSPHWKKQLGYQPDEMPNRLEEFQCRLHPSERDHVLARVREYLAQPYPNYEIEFRLRHRDGSYRAIHCRAELLPDATGARCRMIGTHLDITVRKHTEEVLKFLVSCGAAPGEDFFEALAPFLAQSLGMDYVCIDRLHPDLLAAQTVAVYFDGKFEDNISYTLKDTPCGEAVGRNICCHAKDVRHLFPKDVVLQEMRAESYVGTTLWSSKGQPIGLIAVIGRRPLADPQLAISILQLVGLRAAGELERRQAEAALRQSELRYRAIGESIDYGVWVCAPDGRNIYASPSFLRLVGLTQQQCSDFGWGNVLHPDDAEPTVAAWKECVRTGGTWDIEHRYRGVDGQWHPILARGVPVRDDHGRITCWAGINLDISRLKRTEQALQEAQAKVQAHADELEKTVARRTARLHESIGELEHFSYAITHDMRAPLRAMQGFADMIQEECAGCERPLSQQYFQRIKRASSRMDQLITDSLSYSKAVRLELSLEPVDLGQLVPGLVESYPNLQPDKADITIDGTLPPVLGNEAALTQCFSNLLGNAVKFVPPGTRPSVRVWADSSPAGRVRVWVQDNGIGIPQAFHRRIFEMFQRATKDYEGTGVGLAIVSKVVQRMGGQVGVESHEGQGSRFWVELQAADHQPRPLDP